MRAHLALFGCLIVALVVLIVMLWKRDLPWEQMSAEQRLADVRERREASLAAELQAQGLALGDAAFVRVLKESSELELWLRPRAGKAFQRFKTWPIAKWSGTLGPKQREGDGQAPEGFYDVVPERMNPLSKYHLAFNIGYPNAFDASLSRTGSFIMVHGSNMSVGCFAMTDLVIEEIYLIVDAALRAGQTNVPVHCFPFRMTDQRLAAAPVEWAEFWRNLKQGWDRFEATHVPPSWTVRDGRYAFE